MKIPVFVLCTGRSYLGHRFYGIMTLAIYAKKCGIDEDELRRDAFALLRPYDDMSVEDINRFTKDDGDLIDSEIMQLYPVDFAKELLTMFSIDHYFFLQEKTLKPLLIKVTPKSSQL